MDMLMQSLWIFPIYSFLGWCLEVIFKAVQSGKFVNRGFLNGSVCPIYGIAAMLLIPILTPVKYHLLLLFFGSVIVASLLELIVGVLLKKCFHTSWWDYSHEPFNIGGYICLKFSLAWGVASVVLLRVIHPPIAEIVSLIPAPLLTALLLVFYGGFIVDVTATVVTVLKFNRDLREISHLAELIRRSSDRMTEGIGAPALRTAERIRESEFAEKAKEQSARIQDTRERLQAKLEDFERLNSLLEKQNAIRSRLLRAFPRMKNLRDGGALQEIKRRIQKRRGQK